MFDFLNKLGMALKFAWKRTRSHTVKSEAKDNGKAASTVGDHNSIQIADTIHNFMVPQSPAKQNKAQKALKELFSKEKAQHIALSINSKKRAKEQQNCNDWKMFIAKKFEHLCLIEQDPRYKKFITTQEDAEIILQDLIKSRDKDLFIEKWTALGERLEKL